MQRPRRLCGAAVCDGVVHLYAERVGDILQALEVDTGVAVGLPALDLLLGDADATNALHPTRITPSSAPRSLWMLWHEATS
jgi:hypothetical protein